MADKKKQMTETEVAEVETKLIPLLKNDPSDPVTLKGGEKVVFQRPSMSNKYRHQIWLTKKLKEVGIEATDEDSEYLFYFQYFSLLNGHVVSLTTPEGEEYTYDQKSDQDYKFLFEKYAVEEYFNKNKAEEDFVLDAIEKFVQWQNDTSVGLDELKNS